MPLPDDDDFEWEYETEPTGSHAHPTQGTRFTKQPVTRLQPPDWVIDPLPYVRRTNTLVGLEWAAPYWVADITRLLRLQGILVMTAPNGARLRELSVGSRRVLPLAGELPILLSTFTLIEKLDRDGREMSRARPHLPTCEPGTRVRLRVSDVVDNDLGPEHVEMTLWGITAE